MSSLARTSGCLKTGGVSPNILPIASNLSYILIAVDGILSFTMASGRNVNVEVLIGNFVR